MHDSDLRDLDLNLVMALHALLAERHVTRAAKRIGLTQSAMSHALGRLRKRLGDPLLVRVDKKMVPSPRAEAMRGPLERALADIAAAMAVPRPFDPAKARLRFTIVTSDYIELVLLPKLLARIWAEAPGIDLRLVPTPPAMWSSLAGGEVDLIINLTPTEAEGLGRGFIVQRLFRERFVCVLRKDHPHAQKRLDLETFVSLPHALVSPKGDAGSVVDTVLEKLGKTRRVAVTVPHFLVAPHLVHETDAVLTLAERVANTFAPSLKLSVMKPPVEIPGFSMSMIWHERQRADPAHAWMRARVLEVAKRI